MSTRTTPLLLITSQWYHYFLSRVRCIQ